MFGPSVFMIEWGREVPCCTLAPCAVFPSVALGFIEGRTGSLSSSFSFSMGYSILAKSVFLPKCIEFVYGEQVGAHKVML